MDWEGRVVELRQGKMLVQPLDGSHPIWLKVSRCAKVYIENELLRFAALPKEVEGKGPVPAKVLGCRLDPSSLNSPPPQIELYDPEEQAYAFVDGLPFEEHERFDDSLEFLSAHRHKEARRAILSFLADHPLHIDSYQHLGIIAWRTGEIVQARKYYEMGWRIGRMALPNGFSGKLPWLCLENRPFLRACQSRALHAMTFFRPLEAIEGFEEILRFNPNDNQGIRYLLPSVLAKTGAWERAKEVLDREGVDGTNIYTRCLFDIKSGRPREALRWLCAAVSYNPHIALLLIGKEAEDQDPSSPLFRCVGGYGEALDYWNHERSLWSEDALAFLGQVLALRPFANRLAKLLAIERALKDSPVREERLRLVDKRHKLFGRAVTPKIVKDCLALL